MPTVWREGPYRFYFFSHEPNEPPHVHVDREACTAKFWLRPVRLAKGIGFAARELRRLQRTIETEQPRFEQAWDDFFGAGGR